MSRFKLSVPKALQQPQPRPAWELAPAFTVEYYMDSAWERPVRMLLRNRFQYKHTEFCSKTPFLARTTFTRGDGMEVQFYHTARLAEFRIRKNGTTLVEETFIDVYRMTKALREHFTYETGRAAA